MNEGRAIRAAARAAPWLAPLPSAYFVARSTLAHLLAGDPPALGLAVAVVAGLVVELVSLAAFHTLLDLQRWNRRAEAQHWERAPLGAAWFAVGCYVAGVVVLLVALEAAPQAARFAPMLFPLLAVAGVVTLAVIGQHEDRKARYHADDALRVRRMPAEVRRTETHEPEARVYVCAVCGARVEGAGAYAAHMRWTHGGNGRAKAAEAGHD